jgi:hypothetical protein
VLLHVCEEGDTSHIIIASLNLLEHLDTYIRGTQYLLGGIPTLRSLAYFETPTRWAHTVYPFDQPPMMVDWWTFTLAFVRLGHRTWNNTLETKI